MALEKMSIRPLDGEPIKVMFNPNTYTITKTVAWTPTTSGTGEAATTDRSANAPTTTFSGGGSRQLAIELFFDVTESSAAEKDVRTETDKIVRLTRIERKEGRPPICEVQWGGRQTEDFPFIGTVSNLTQRFMLFHQSGLPLRATLNVTFTEFLDRETDQRKTDPEMTTRIVRRGDTLASIAADVYRNPALWRVIADTNRIEDPFNVPAGLKLTLPKR